MKFIWSPGILNTNMQIQVYFRWTPDGYWTLAGLHLNSVGECKVLSGGIPLSGPTATLHH
jgi:hypothetical protein